MYLCLILFNKKLLHGCNILVEYMDFIGGDFKGEGKEIFTPTVNEKLHNQWWNMSILSRNVRRLRKERGLTQSDLAILADIQPYQVCYIEGNKYYNVSFRTVGFVARALGVTVSVLTDPN